MIETLEAQEVETLTLLGTRVLIRPDEWEERTKGGIIKPDTARQRVQRGTVTHTGPKCEVVKVGQRVIYPRWAACDVRLNEETLYLFNEEQIHAILGGAGTSHPELT